MSDVFDWSSVRLAVFDIDGTLYDQRALRLRMLSGLVRHAIGARSWRTIRVLRAYRAFRDSLGQEEVEYFDDVLLARTAGKTGLTTHDVGQIVRDWMICRPLPYLRSLRYSHVSNVFAELRRRNITIGVFSDYPAEAKLSALGLAADVVVWAGDARVNILKPNPRGLLAVMERAGCNPNETVMIGDRVERDGAVAIRAGTRALIRTRGSHSGCVSFTTYRHGPFAPLFMSR